MRVAVIGSGITGLGAAIALHQKPGVELVVFERESRVGGHAHTIDINHDGRNLSVDTGFIVYNELNYPNFSKMLAWLDVESIISDMSFALSAGNGAFEWAGRHQSPMSGLFAQRRNWFDPAYYLFLLGIRKFQQKAMADVASGYIGQETLGQYLAARGISARVRDDYVLPMGAAIWSMTPGETLGFPAKSFLAFFSNHKLLQWDRPLWRTVRGGSRNYVKALQAQLGDSIRTSCPIWRVRRLEDGVELTGHDGAIMRFDAVIFATHAPTALHMLVDPTAEEKQVLGAFRVRSNRVVVHRDTSLMPHRKAAWASWNLLRKQGSDDAGVTYWMNLLQSLPDEHPVFVTLNPDRLIDTSKIFASFAYDHPIYDKAAISAQEQLPVIQGINRTWFAGAWAGYGFHEDGLRSGLAAAEALGAPAPWLK